MALPSNRLSEPTINFIQSLLCAWLGSYDPKSIIRKIEAPIFQVKKLSTETTATTFNISGIQAQHEQVAMAMHGVTTDTRYIHKKQNSNNMYICISMVIH